MVSVIDPEPPTVDEAANVTAPLAMAAVPVLIKAPAPPTPAPERLNALATLNPPKSIVPPLATVTVLVPKGPLITAPVEAIPALAVPPLFTCVPPV